MYNFLRTVCLSSLLLITSCEKSSLAPVKGCMDPESVNYNSLATEDDGTCVYLSEEINPVITEMTATWCGPCGNYGKPVAERLKNKLPSNATYISCHIDRSYFFNKYSKAYYNQIVEKTGVPVFFINNIGYLASINAIKTTGKLLDNYDLATKTHLTSGITGYFTQKDSADLKVIKANLWIRRFDGNNDSLKASVIILEDSLKWFQAGINDTIIHNSLIRGYLGDKITNEIKHDFLGISNINHIKISGSTQNNNWQNLNFFAILLKQIENDLVIVNSNKIELKELTKN